MVERLIDEPGLYKGEFKFLFLVITVLPEITYYAVFTCVISNANGVTYLLQAPDKE